MYKFANQKDVRALTKWCDGIINEVQKEVKEYVTFSFNLIGSGGKRLVTQNGDEAFDLDYNIIIQKDKQGLVDDPKRLKDIIRHAFDIVLQEEVEEYSGTSDSTSVLTVSITDGKKRIFSFDVEFSFKTIDVLKNIGVERDKKFMDYALKEMGSLEVNLVNMTGGSEFEEEYKELTNIICNRLGCSKKYMVDKSTTFGTRMCACL